MASCTPPPNWPWCDPAQFDSRQCYRCMSPAAPYEDEFGQDGADIHGTTVGCKPCQDIPTFWFNQWPHPDGVRFLARSHSGFERDAEGKVGDVMSWQPLKFPGKLDLIRAGCVRYSRGRHFECFNEAACKCPKTTDPRADVDGNCHVDGFTPTPLGERQQGIFPDCFAYHDPLGSAQYVNNAMFVRDVLYAASDSVRAGSSVPWMNTAVHVSGDRRVTPCTVNKIATCTSEVYSGSVCGGALHNNDLWWIEGAGGERVPPDTYLYDVNAGVRQFFRQAAIQECTARLNTNPNNKWIDHRVARMKNRVLDFCLRGYGRQRGLPTEIPSKRIKFDAIDTEEGDFRLYRRQWSAYPVEPCANRLATDTIIALFAPSTLRSRPGVNIGLAWAVTSVDISADILVLKSQPVDYTGQPHYENPEVHEQYRLMPHVGIFIRILGTPVAYLNPGEPLPDGWRIVNGPVCRGYWTSGQRRDMSPDGMPRIVDSTGREVDRIVYRDFDGQYVRPFFEIVWQGLLNDFSVPRTHNILKTWRNRTWQFDPTNQGVAHGCGALAEAFDGVFVPGYPVHAQSNANDPAQLYHGGVTLTFRHGAYYPGG